MNRSKIACLCALGALLCSCQSAWAKPSPEPKPPQSPADGQDDSGKSKDGKAKDGKAEDDQGDEGKGRAGQAPKGDDGKTEPGTGGGDKPADGKEPSGKEPSGKGADGKPDDGKPDDGKSAGGADEPAKPEPPPATPPVVEHTEPKFIGGGEVPKVTAYLAKTLKPVAQCVADHGGLEAGAGDLEVQFLVRARGRAEGVEVLARKAVSAEAGRCVRKLLKNAWVGTPTNDPVGVTFHYRLKRAQ